MTTTRPIRRRLMGTYTQNMGAPRPSRSIGSGMTQMMAIFAVVLLAGFLLLLLPVAAEDGEWANPRIALFTAISAISVTGLAVVDTPSHWSGFGQAVIIALVQVGGLGYMLGTTVVLWALGRRLGVRDRQMLRLYYGAPSMSETLSFARSVGLFTLLFEGVGALVLTVAFIAGDVPAGRSLWWGFFHSVSAFNNAGYSITGSDMNRFADDPGVLLPLTVLTVAGGLGFLPVATLWKRRSFARTPLDHKLIFLATGALLAAGTIFIGGVEWRNSGTLGAIEPAERPVVAFFHTASARTAGFAAFDVTELEDESKLAIIGLMFVGGAAGSTAGGLKVGAFSLLLVAMIATLRRQDDIAVFGRRVPDMLIRQATTLALSYVALVFAFTMALAAASDHTFLDVLFEAVSALCTVGSTTANTPGFGTAAQVVLMVAMAVGRFFPLLLVLHITRPRQQAPYHYPEDSIRLG